MVTLNREFVYDWTLKIMISSIMNFENISFHVVARPEITCQRFGQLMTHYLSRAGNRAISSQSSQTNQCRKNLYVSLPSQALSINRIWQ